MKFKKSGKENLNKSKLTRKSRRAKERKNKKVKSAVNYIKSKKRVTDKIDFCPSITNSYLHKSQSPVKNLPKNKVEKFIKRDKKVKNKIDDNITNDSFKFSDKMSARFDKLREFVENESKKIVVKNKSFENQQELQKVNKKSQKNVIKNEVKLENLQSIQDDIVEINKYARKLQLNKHQKKKLFPSYELEFGSILDDIENKNFSEKNYEFQSDANINLEDDLMTVCTNNQILQKSNFKRKKNEEGNLTDTGTKVDSDLSDSDVEYIDYSNEILINKKLRKNVRSRNLIDQNDSDSVTSISKENSQNSTLCKNKSDNFKNGNNFLDDEAEEASSESENDGETDIENDIIFQSGSTLPSSSNEGSKSNYANNFTINDIFEDHLSSSENESDLEDFVVDDDFIEYESSDTGSLDGRANGEQKNLNRKYKRILTLQENKEQSPLKVQKIRNKRSNCNSGNVEQSIKEKKSNVTKIHKENSQNEIKENSLRNSEDKGFHNLSESSQFIPKNKSILKISSKKDQLIKKRVSFDLQNEENSNCNTEEHTVFKEDIYGRLVDKEGNIVKSESEIIDKNSSKYVPPALRKLMAMNTSKQKTEQLSVLKRKLKGLFNRLAESNMAGILSQIESSYQNNSKNDMNQCMYELICECIICELVVKPERLIQEYALLVAILAANVGSEVGAHILTEFVLQWKNALEYFIESSENKALDNITLFLCHLYNFKVFDSILIYDLLNKILQFGLEEKPVELILHILRSVGFTLRKDNPLALKSFITVVQQNINSIKNSKINLNGYKLNQDLNKFPKVSMKGSQNLKNENFKNFKRIDFMLEILTAIKNNNVTKMPNYDPSHTQHLKTTMKGLIRKGCRCPELKINLEDLIKSKIMGKWWLVGSAWSNGLKENMEQNAIDETKPVTNIIESNQFSETFRAKAAKLHMSRTPRINILYALTEGSDDHKEAVEQIIQLKLPTYQYREIFNVMIYCLLRCKEYTQFYHLFAINICKCKKGFARILRFTIFDQFKEISNMKAKYVSNLAKFLSNLIAEDTLDLSVFQNIDFSSVDNCTVSFLRQVFISILLHPLGTAAITLTFSKLCSNPKFNVLRQYVKLFISKFVKTSKFHDKNTKMLETRVKKALAILSSANAVQL